MSDDELLAAVNQPCPRCGHVQEMMRDNTVVCSDLFCELRAETERLRQALTQIAERANWQISAPDCYGGANYEWIGDGGEAFEIAAAALRPEAPDGG